jgi:hypothetical protein
VGWIEGADCCLDVFLCGHEKTLVGSDLSHAWNFWFGLRRLNLRLFLFLFLLFLGWVIKFAKSADIIPFRRLPLILGLIAGV